MSERRVLVCNWCGDEADWSAPPTDWLYLTQPLRCYCPKCKQRVGMGAPEQKALSSCYDADYFLRGQQLGISGYTDYRWLPDLTIPMAGAMISHLGIAPEDTILDFGCARGYLVKAFRQLGYNAYGVDCSTWAVTNCDPEVRGFIYHRSDARDLSFSWVVAKDVLEHVAGVDLVIAQLMDAATRGVFAVVPLSAQDGNSYAIGAYERDVTHVHRLTLASWVRMFAFPGWRVECSYRVKGVKDNYWKPGYERGNGFIVTRREE